MTEIVGKEHRRLVGILYQMFISLGIILRALLAYCVPDWRWLQVIAAGPYLLFLSYYWWEMLRFSFRVISKVEMSKCNFPTKILSQKQIFIIRQCCFKGFTLFKEEKPWKNVGHPWSKNIKCIYHINTVSQAKERYGSIILINFTVALFPYCEVV